jgi:serine/threonine protein phosphatase 1
MNEPRTRLAVVGDVHGDAERLARALDALLADVATPIVFTGDYVNRGPDSWRVLELLIAARDRHSAGITLIRGNHEDALLEFLNGGSLSDFAAHGGLATIRSYLTVVRTGAVEEFKDGFPKEHRALLEGMPLFYENDILLISHAGFDPADPSARTPEILYGGSHPELFSYEGPWPRSLTVCGHYIQPQGQPYNSEHLICLDTGCGTLPGSPLTVLHLPERKFRQF